MPSVVHATVTYAKRHITAPYAECYYTWCRYVECRSAFSIDIQSLI